MKNNNPIRAVALITSFFLMSVFLGESPSTSQSPKSRFLNPPPEYIEYFHFGFRESLADSFWLRWIQDNDVCQTFVGQGTLPTRQAAPEYLSPRNKICDYSWSFKMLDAITRLSPRFAMPYKTGAITLAVLVEDYTGAKVIFDRGVEAFPHDWSLLYQAAYHALFDLQDLSRAAELMNRAAENGAPIWVRSIAARLYSKTGQSELGIATLEQYKKTVTNPKAIEDIDKRISELKRQMNQ